MSSKGQIVKRILDTEDELAQTRRLELEARMQRRNQVHREGLDAQIRSMVDEYVAVGGPEVSHDMWAKQMAEDPDGTAAQLAASTSHVPRIESSRHVKTSAADAEARLANGEHPATVFQQTGWYRVPDGPKDRRMRFYLSDADSRIDADMLRRRALDQDLSTGEVKPVNFTVGEVLSHEDLYEVYPELRDVQVMFHIKRLEGDRYVIYDPDKAGLGLDGQLSTRGGVPRISVFNNRNSDLGKKTILHEINHVIANLEGWSKGSSSTIWRDMLTRAQTLVQDKRMLDDVMEGRVDLDDIADMARYADEYAERWGVDPEVVDKSLADIAQMPDLEDYAEAVGPILDRDLRDVALFLKQMGANEDADVVKFLDEAPPGVINQLARGRYLRQLGEMESRVREHLSDLTIEQIKELRKTPIETIEDVDGTRVEDAIP